jgi:hypothetical protein
MLQKFAYKMMTKVVGLVLFVGLGDFVWVWSKEASCFALGKIL